MTDNKSAFAVNQYDENVRKVIPHYDEIYEQIFSVINTYCGDKPLAVPDTGCGTGNFGVLAMNRLCRLRAVLAFLYAERLLRNKRVKRYTADFRIIVKYLKYIMEELICQKTKTDSK